jgi:hypothetical protein
MAMASGSKRGRRREVLDDARPVTCEGQRLIRAIVRDRGAAEVARKTKKSLQCVGHWTTGRRKPDAAARLLLQKHYDIEPIEPWEAAPAKTGAVASAGKQAELTPEQLRGIEERARLDKGIAARDLAHEQLIALRARIGRQEAMGVGAREIGVLENSYTAAVRLYARLSGELEITEAALMRSSAYVKFMRIVGEALEKFPAAAKAVREALEQYGES